MFNGHQGYSISETQMVGNCIEVCTTIKKKREWERIERERERGWDIRRSLQIKSIWCLSIAIGNIISILIWANLNK